MSSFANDSGIFDTVTGLPVHPLVVHVAVIILPLSALAFIGLVAIRRLRRGFGWLTVLGLLVGAGASFVAKESGEALAKRVGTPVQHANCGSILPAVAVALAILALVWMIVQRTSARAGSRTAAGLPAATDAGGRRSGDSSAAKLFGGLGVLVALAVLGLTVLVGHSGAEAVWKAKIEATNETAPATPANPAAPTTSPPASPTTSASTSPTTSASTSPTTSASTSSTSSSTTSTSAPAAGAAAYSMAQLQQHASASSCWTVVSGGVYDLTTWISRHKGGASVITRLCGADGTASFVAEHGTAGEAVEQLKEFKIGTLA